MKTQKKQKNIIQWIMMLIIISVGCSKMEPGLLDVKTVETKAASIDSLNAKYIDPSASVNGNGTKASPWNGSVVSDGLWKANTIYLFKKGTTFSHSDKINIQVSGVYIGAYGSGERPIIKQSGNANNIQGVGSLTLQGIELVAPTGSGGSDADQLAFWPGTGYLTLDNCKIHGGSHGVWAYNCPTMDIKITNTDIYDVWSDGLFIYVAKSLEVGYCKIYNVNVSHPNYPDDGDNIHTDDIGTVYIHHNLLDHTTQPGKFCLLLGSVTNPSNFVTNATIEYNTMKRTRTGTDNTVFYAGVGKSVIKFRYNKVSDALLAIQSRTYDMQIYYNTFTNLDLFMELSSQSGTSAPKLWNNTIYNVGQVISGYGENVDFKNNIIHTVTGTAYNSGNNIVSDYNNYYNVPKFGGVGKGSHDMASDPLFNNIANADFTLKSGSPCIGKGTLLSLLSDILGKALTTSVDMGAYAYNSGSVVVPPVSGSPTCQITAPYNGQNYNAPASILITANASDASGTITKVEYYNGSVKLGESTSAPYSYSWTNVPAGIYNLTAVATNSSNVKTTSVANTIYVNGSATTPPPVVVNKPPVVSLTGPYNGQNFKAPAQVIINATASDADGNITKVEFYSGSVKLGQCLTAPYTFTWANAPAGAYDITAVATDNSNNRTTSGAITIWINK